MVDATSGFTCEDLMVQTVITKGLTKADLNADSALEEQLLDALNLIQMDYCGRQDWNFLHSTGTLSITNGTASYTLSSNVEKLEVLYDKTNNRIIRPANNKDITRADPNEDWTGDPDVYSRWGDRGIILQPIPDANGTLYYRAKILPTHLTAKTNYLTVPYKYQGTILHGLKAWFYDIRDDQRADRERQLFDLGVTLDWEKDVFDLDDATRFISYEEWMDTGVQDTYENYLQRYFG